MHIMYIAIYKTNPNNLYISLVYANVLIGQGKIDRSFGSFK